MRQPFGHSDLASYLGRNPDATYSDDSGTIRRWTELGRVIAFSAAAQMTGAAVEWATGQMNEVLAANARRRIYVIWDISGVTGQLTRARQLSARWFMTNRSRVLRFILLLPPSSLVRMAATVSLAAVGASRHVYREPAPFVAAVHDTLTHLRDNMATTGASD